MPTSAHSAPLTAIVDQWLMAHDAQYAGSCRNKAVYKLLVMPAIGITTSPPWDEQAPALPLATFVPQCQDSLR